MPGGHSWNAPYIPMDFSVTMPHHLGQTDTKGGAYAREGKSYHRLWLHAICYGGKTRYFSGDGVYAQQLRATEAYFIPVPGEELNKQSVGEVDITLSLTNPLPVQSTYDVGEPWDNNDDARSLYRGIHPIPVNERKVSGRGVTICLFVRDIASKVRVNGWGGEFGPGPLNIYGEDPEYPYPVTP